VAKKKQPETPLPKLDPEQVQKAAAVKGLSLDPLTTITIVEEVLKDLPVVGAALHKWFSKPTPPAQATGK
jgi:hypothetical protein